MEKYAKLLKGLEVCAGPDCCKDGCPYYGKTTGGMTCRARLLADAAIAINNEQTLRKSAEEGLRNVVEALDIAETVNNNIRADRESLSKELEKVDEGYRSMTNELARLHADVDDLEAANNTLRAERDGLRIELEMLRKGKTDRPSVGIEGSTAYWCGRADALAEVVSSIVGEASGHE